MLKVFVNGTFDLLHPGHIALLQYAKSYGDFLWVAIDGDTRVRKLKGDSRPINSEQIRKNILESIRYVDLVSVFYSDEDLEDTIKNYAPDLMVVGSDYTNKRVIGSEYAKKLIFFERDERYSSSKIIEDISSGRRV